MREILFRGKDAVTGKWFYGDLLRKDISCYIVYPVETWEDDYSVENSAGAPGRKKKIVYVEKRVMEETIGQYTGMVDMNMNKIYNGDRVSIKRMDFKAGGFMQLNLYVKWGEWCYQLWVHDKFISALDAISARECEVTGNIHDK